MNPALIPVGVAIVTGVLSALVTNKVLLAVIVERLNNTITRLERLETRLDARESNT